jgi:multidrug resistance efflux pump
MQGTITVRKEARGPALIAISALWAAAGWCATCEQSSAQPNAATSAVTAPGRIEAASRMLIGTAASGTIAELPVREGARVQAGQLLARLDCTNLEKELQGKTSALAASEAILARVTEGSRPEEIASGVAAVALAQARAEEAEVSLHRLEPSEGISVTQAQLDQSKRDARIAAAQLDEARAKLALLRAGSRREEVLEAQSRRDAAKAGVEEAAARLNYCSVRAPAGGVVVAVHVTLGQFVGGGTPAALLTLVDDDSPRRVKAEVDARDIAKVCAKQQAVVTSESFPGAALDAVTERINGEMTRATMASTDRTAADRDVREVTLSLAPGKVSWPAGLRVLVKFQAGCPAGQGEAPFSPQVRPPRG